MKITHWLMTIFFAFSGMAFAVTEEQTTPELPLELFAAHAKFQSMQISPDGKHIAFLYEEDDNEVKMAVITSDMKKVTASFGFGKNQHVGSVTWLNNKRILFTVSEFTGWLDNKGKPTYIVAANYDGSNRRKLIHNDMSFHQIVSSLRNDPKHVLVAKFHFADIDGLRLHKLNVDTGKLKYIGGIPRPAFGSEITQVVTDNEDKVRFALEWNAGKDKYRFEDDKLTFHFTNSKNKWSIFDVKAKRANPTIRMLGFSADNSTLYLSSNHDMAKNDTQGVFSFNLEDHEIKLVFRHPEVDITDAVVGLDGELLGVRYEPGYPETFYLDENNPQVKLRKQLSASFKGQQVRVNRTLDGTKSIVSTFSDKNPGDFYLFDSKKGQMKYLASTHPAVKPKQMASTEAFTMVTRDGVKLYGYLTLPNDKPAKNLPLVVNPHGGPFGPKDSWGYNRELQLFANRGYAVLQVNFRGSGGYGDDFMQSGFRKWGQEMQDDVTDATKWAIKQGIADPDRICLYGGSYGGYATLQGVVKEPELYKCGVGIAGVYSLPLMWTEDGDGTTAQRIKGTHAFLERAVGERGNKKMLEENSPALNVDKIKAALFIIHGSNDERVPIEHAYLLKKNLDKIGKSYEWLVRKEGHGFTQEKNRIDQYEQVLAFFEKHIGKGSSTEYVKN